MKTSKSYKDLFCPSYNFYPNKITNIIELNEDKEEEDGYFLKSFNEIFSIHKNDFFEADIPEENIFFIDKKGSDMDKSSVIVVIEDEERQHKKGRLHKNAIPSYKIKKDKFDINNIIQKIIRHLVNVFLSYINKKYEENNIETKSETLFRSIDAKAYNVYSNKKIYELFHKNLGDLFSANISDKNFDFLRTHPGDYNKKQIEIIKKDNKEKSVIELLDLTLKEMYEKYLNDELGEFNLQKDLIEIEGRDGKEYKDKYKEVALNLIEIINKKGEKINKCKIFGE